MLEESAHLSETGTTRNPRSRKKPKKSTSKTVSAADSDSDFERVQKKILLFFGSLESSVYEYLLPDADELGQLATALDSERHLKFSVPFPDSRPLIYLVILLLILPLFILNKLKWFSLLRLDYFICSLWTVFLDHNTKSFQMYHKCREIILVHTKRPIFKLSWSKDCPMSCLNVFISNYRVLMYIFAIPNKG